MFSRNFGLHIVLFIKLAVGNRDCTLEEEEEEEEEMAEWELLSHELLLNENSFDTASTIAEHRCISSLEEITATMEHWKFP
uniref:Bm9280, isoform a n=1 Tax=Brugia malayi TaxID=6279 RepID=A0A1I9G811_BRUMA|nr:Bm9280, isoform a [Brugia malayi]